MAATATRQTTRQTIQAALDRARGRSILVRPVGRGPGGAARYLVPSASDTDTAYVVDVAGSGLAAEQYRCDCPAAARPACWHRAAAFSLRVNAAAWHSVPTTTEQADRAAAAAAELAAIRAMFDR